MTRTVTFVATEGCLGTSIVAPMDLLETCNGLYAAMTKDQPNKDQLNKDKCPLFAWQLLSIDGEPVRLQNGMTVPVDGGLDGFDRADLVILAARAPYSLGELEHDLSENKPILNWLENCYINGATLATSCTGSFYFAEAGLLDNKIATSSWWFTAAFKDRYPQVNLQENAIVTEEARLICAGAAMSLLDLALYLIEKYVGAELARLCSRYMVLDNSRNSQAPYRILNSQLSNDVLVRRAQEWIQDHLFEDIKIEALAANLAVSPRTLARHFKNMLGDNPQTFVQKVRIERSKQLLETTTLSVEQIIEQVGYQDDSAFRRIFKKYTDLSPRKHRQKFQKRVLVAKTEA